jgi:hypothetical protein
MRIAFRSYLELLSFEYSLFRKDFSAIYDRVGNTPVRALRQRTIMPEQVCQSVNLAAILYFKPVLCLQRSAATTCLLKKYGFPAEMVIGVQQFPFLAHAWVEINGRIINDKPYISEIYAVLSRC